VFSRRARARGAAQLPSPPEVFEPVRRQLSVPHRVLDVSVAKVGLQGARVVPLVDEGEATGVPQHVRMSFEGEPSLDTRTLDHPRKACRGEG